MRMFSKIPKKMTSGFVSFYDIVASGWTEQTDNDLEATASNYDWTSRFKYDLTQIGDYFEFIIGSAYGVWADNPNGNFFILGANKDLYGATGSYGSSAGLTNIGASGATTGQTLRYEIVDVSGDTKLRLKNITAAATIHTSSFNLDLSGGNRVEGRFGAYGDSIGAIFTKPIIVSGGVTY